MATADEISEELAHLTEENKATLVLLWAANPKDSVAGLTQKLNKKIEKSLRVQTVKQELEILGLLKADPKMSKELIG